MEPGILGLGIHSRSRYAKPMHCQQRQPHGERSAFMKSFPVNRALFLASLSLIAGLASARAQETAAATSASSTPGVNLAVVATPSSSFVSGDRALTALNDGFNPRNSRDASRGSYGNWPRTGAQWVELDWSQPINTKQIDVYWWADGAGI